MILIINGPSGSGKTTLGRFLKENGMKEIVSSTTRERRTGEKHGEDYYFLSKEEFLNEDMIEESVYAGNRYGVSRKEAEKGLRSEKGAFAVLDINGVKKFREIFGKEKIRVVYIDVIPEKLSERMKARGDSFENIKKRMENYYKSDEAGNKNKADITLDNNGTLLDLKQEAEKLIKLYYVH